jgi:hypothetical protein
MRNRIQGFSGSAQHAREFFVDRRKPLLGIDDKQENIAVAHGGFDRMFYVGDKLGLSRAAHPAGVPKCE